MASNLVFWKNVTVSAGGPADGLIWISLPYAYTPPDYDENGLVDAEDLVQDLQPTTLNRPCTAAANDCAIMKVWAWNVTTGTYQSWTGGSPSEIPFELDPGMAYGLEIRAVAGQTAYTLNLVGAHDRAFAHSDCYDAGAVNMRWISIPPNLAIDLSYGTVEVLDAEDLGQALGGRDHIYQIRRFDETTGAFDSWVVGSQYGAPFELDLDRGYAIDLTCTDPSAACAQCPWMWAPTVR